MLGFPPHSCWWKHLLFSCLSTPIPLSLPPGRLSYFYLKASLLAKAMLLCPPSHLHHAGAWPACSTDTVPSNTPLPTPIFQEPRPLMDHPTALLDGLVAPVPLGRMTQRRHYANRCLSGALPPYCCCCHKDQLRTVYINLNAPWGWGCKTKQHRPWKSCRCAEEED